MKRTRGWRKTADSQSGPSFWRASPNNLVCLYVSDHNTGSWGSLNATRRFVKGATRKGSMAAFNPFRLRPSETAAVLKLGVERYRAPTESNYFRPGEHSKRSRKPDAPAWASGMARWSPRPHCEQFAVVSTLAWPLEPPSWRLPLHALQRLGSFLKFLSAKNCCSPAVKTKSAPQSTHFSTRS